MPRRTATPETSPTRTPRRAGTFVAVLTAAAALALAPVSAASADTAVTTIADLANAFATQPSGSTITLDADLTGDATSDAVEVPAGRALTLDLNGHRLTLVGDDSDLSGPAGLGVPAGTALTIVDTAPGGAVGALTATGATGGAGIGGSRGEAGGTIVIDGGIITTTSVFAGAGIGGGWGGDGGTVTINGGTIDSTGGDMAAAIGGGHSGDGGTIVIDGGIVTARATTDAAAIGGGVSGAGASLSIGAGAMVTAVTGYGTSPIGPGNTVPDSSDFGSLSNAGTLIVMPLDRLVIPSGVTVTNSGTIRNGGALEVSGTLANTGVILNVNPGNPTPILNPLNVTGHNTTVLLDGTGGTAPANPAVVYAGTFDDGQVAFPADATRSGFAFDGWFTQAVGGTRVTATTGLGAGGPTTLTLYAHWSDLAAAGGSPELAATGPDALLPIGLTGAALLLVGLVLRLRRRIAAG